MPGTGSDIGLAVALNIDADNYKSSVRQFVGATVLIHDPLDYPDIGAQSASLQPGHVMSMTLTGTKLESSKDIQNIPLSKRMCLFDGEVRETIDVRSDQTNLSVHRFIGSSYFSNYLFILPIYISYRLILNN